MDSGCISGQPGADASDCVVRGMQREFDLLARDQPTFQISGSGGIDFLHGGIGLAYFVNFSAHGCCERQQAFAQALAGS